MEPSNVYIPIYMVKTTCNSFRLREHCTSVFPFRSLEKTASSRHGHADRFLYYEKGDIANVG